MMAVFLPPQKESKQGRTVLKPFSLRSERGRGRGGTRAHADLLNMPVISPPVRGTRSTRWCPLRAPLGQELQ